MPALLPLRTTLRVAAAGAALLVAGPDVRAQPAVGDERDISQADVELRRRLTPLVPQVRAALEGNDRDAQRAALGIVADFPPALATDARLPGMVAAFLMRDGNDRELTAMGLRAYGRLVPDPRYVSDGPDPIKAYAANLSKVADRHFRSEAVDVRRATAEALATSVQGTAPPANKTLPAARYFIEVATAAVPLMADGLADRDETVERGCLEGLAIAGRYVADLYKYTYDPEAVPVEPKTKPGASRFERLAPVLRGLAAAIPQVAKPLAGREPATRLQAARTLEALAVTRRTVLNARPAGELAPAEPFPDAFRSLHPALAERVTDSDPQVRLAAVEAMEPLDDALDTREPLRRATTDRVVFVRWAAARALGRVAPPTPAATDVAADVAALAKLVSDADPDVRTAALTAIARFGPAAKSAVPAVLDAAGRGDVEPRVAAVKALAALETDPTKTVPVLTVALRDPDLRLRRVAAAGLTRFGPDAKAALPELRKAVLSDDPELRLAAAEAILAIQRVPRMKEL